MCLPFPCTQRVAYPFNVLYLFFISRFLFYFFINFPIYRCMKIHIVTICFLLTMHFINILSSQAFFHNLSKFFKIHIIFCITIVNPTLRRPTIILLYLHRFSQVFNALHLLVKSHLAFFYKLEVFSCLRLKC